MKITTKAQKYLDQLGVGTRTDGKEYVFIKDEYTKKEHSKLYESVRTAHGDSFPKDFIYSTFYDLLDAITNYTIKDMDELEELRYEIVESQCSIYTKEQTEWLNSDIDNVDYLSRAVEEVQENEDGYTLLARAQFIAIDEVMDEVINLLSK